MRGWIGAVVLASLLALPIPTVAAASPVEARFQAERVDLRGDMRLEAREGVLNLTPAVEDGHRVSVAWTRATAYRIEQNRTFAAPPGGVVGEVSTADAAAPWNDTFELGAGRILLGSCRASLCTAVLVPDGGAFSLEGAADDHSLLEADDPVWARQPEPAPDSFFADRRAGWLEWRSDTDRLRSGAVRGDATLFVRDIDTAIVDAKGNTKPLDVTARTDTPGGVSSLRRETLRFAVLHLEDATLEAASGAPLVLTAPAATVDLAGMLLAERAEGYVSVDGRASRIEDATLHMEGAFRLTVTAAGGGAILAGPRVATMHATGTADLVAVSSRILVETPPGSPDPAVVAGASLLGILFAALARRIVVVLLYSKVPRALVLRNENRARIYDLVAGHGGISVGEIGAQAGLARMVVRHHLAMLEAHRLVACRKRNGRRYYFLVRDVANPRTSEMQLALKDETRRRLALAVATAASGLTQRDLEATTGLSQRLLSYHLARLESVGLVRVVHGRPKLYSAAPEMTDVLGRPPPV